MDVGQFIGEQELPELILPDIDAISPDNVWVNYDGESDTFIIYLNKKPIPGISYYLTNNLLAITPLESNEVVGFQVEAWEREYVPKHETLASWWPTTKHTLIGNRSWSPWLVMLALVFLLGYVFEPKENEQLALVMA